MTFKEIIKKAQININLAKISQLSENCWLVNDHNVIYITKPGRSRLSCDCENSTRFCNENILCSHMVSVIMFESFKAIGGGK